MVVAVVVVVFFSVGMDGVSVFRFRLQIQNTFSFESDELVYCLPSVCIGIKFIRKLIQNKKEIHLKAKQNIPYIQSNSQIHAHTQARNSASQSISQSFMGKRSSGEMTELKLQ